MTSDDHSEASVASDRTVSNTRSDDECVAEAEMKEPGSSERRKRKAFAVLSAGIGAGVAVGAGIGVVMSNMAAGIGVGLAMGAGGGGVLAALYIGGDLQ